jgi:hypothetical protein
VLGVRLTDGRWMFREEPRKPHLPLRPDGASTSNH